MAWLITTIALPAIAVAAFYLGVRSGCAGGTCRRRGDDDDSPPR